MLNFIIEGTEISLLWGEIARTILKPITIIVKAVAPSAAHHWTFTIFMHACTVNGITISYKGILSVVKNPRAHVHSLIRFAHSLAYTSLHPIIRVQFITLRTHVFSYWSRSLFQCISSIRFVWTSIYANALNAAYVMSFWTCSVACSSKHANKYITNKWWKKTTTTNITGVRVCVCVHRVPVKWITTSMRTSK